MERQFVRFGRPFLQMKLDLSHYCFEEEPVLRLRVDGQFGLAFHPRIELTPVPCDCQD